MDGYINNPLNFINEVVIPFMSKQLYDNEITDIDIYDFYKYIMHQYIEETNDPHSVINMLNSLLGFNDDLYQDYINNTKNVINDLYDILQSNIDISFDGVTSGGVRGMLEHAKLPDNRY